MQVVDYVTPDYPHFPGLVHGMTKPYDGIRYYPQPRQHTLCGREILSWWRRAKRGERRMCQHCWDIIWYLEEIAKHEARLAAEKPIQLQLPFVPPRPDLCP